MDWFHLSEDQEQWWAFVNTVMKLWIPEEAVHFLTNRASQERLFSVELVSAIHIHVYTIYMFNWISQSLHVSFYL